MDTQFSFIYIITDGTNFKIGVSKKDPNLRLKQLQTGHPAKLTLYNSFKVPSDKVYLLEKEAHKIIQYQYPKRGEWFKNGYGWHINLLVDSVCEKYLIED